MHVIGGGGAFSRTLLDLRHVAIWSYEEEDTCMSYEEEDTCMSYEEEDTCMSYEEEDTLICAT